MLAKLFFVCLWTGTETKPISSHLDQTGLVKKGFINGDIFILGKFFFRDTARDPEQGR